MSTFLSRRFANRKAEAIQKMIVFQIQQTLFAVPVQIAHRVVPLGTVFGVMGDVGLTYYQGGEIPVVDAPRRIFGIGHSGLLAAATVADRHLLNGAPDDSLVNNEALVDSSLASPVDCLANDPLDSPGHGDRHLLIVENYRAEFIGIPTDAPPALRKIPRSAFAPLPAAYIAETQMRCVSALIVLSEHEAPIFLLNLDQLLIGLEGDGNGAAARAALNPSS